MNKSGQRFVEMLKKINYPLAPGLHGQSFDWMFEVKEMLPFLEWFCTTVNSDNVLTTDEIADYAALQSYEVTLEPDLLEKAFVALLGKNQDAEDKLRENVVDLKEDMTEIEKHISVLETQKKYLVMKETAMSHNEDELEKVLEQEQQKFTTLEENVPTVETKIVTELERLTNCIQEMNATLIKSNELDVISVSRVLSQLSFKEYLEKENSAFESMKFYLNSQLKQSKLVMQMDNFTSDNVMNYTHFSSPSPDFPVNCVNESTRLKRILQISEENCLGAYSQLSKCEVILKFYKNLLEKKDFVYFLLPLPQLKLNLQKAQEMLERCKQEHQFLLATDVPSSVNNYMQAQSDWIAVISFREKLERYRSYFKKQILPIDILCDQRARLELLLMALAVERKNFKNIRDALQQISNVLEKDLILFLERKSLVSTQVEKTFSENSILQDSSFFISISNILELCENNRYYIVVSDIPKGIELLSNSCMEFQHDLQYMYVEQMQLLKNIENSLSFYDELLHHKKWGPEVHSSNTETDIISVITKLELRQYSLEDIILRAIKEYQKKKKLLGHNKIMQKGRHLFILAFTNREKFNKVLNEIKYLLETSGGKYNLRN